ncbi:MAG: fluoride efflux transporter CrcB [Pseudomonadota bacterium]|nr:fluoride efflux transporter CrcB [Pseudomonadota bacterium]
MTSFILIFLGSGLGGTCRHLVTQMTATLAYFPYGTFLANVTGSLIIGLLTPLLSKMSLPLSSHAQALLITGFCGSYTTFSTFSLNTIELLESGQILLGITNIILNLSLCLLACMSGLYLGRHWTV